MNDQRSSDSSPHTADQAALSRLLDPILARVAQLDVSARTNADACSSMAAALESEFPYASDHVRDLGRRIAAGVRDGWLCNRGPSSARFSRFAKATPESHGLSVDIVDMEGEAIEHTHPKGEVTICFPTGGPDVQTSDDLRFDGHGPGWVVLGPGTRHVPTVVGGRMQLMYFLPDGAVEWHT